MEKSDQDIVWLAERMGIPPEIALRIFREGAMNVDPQPGAAPFNFQIQDDRNLPTKNAIPNYVAPDPSGMPAMAPDAFKNPFGLPGQAPAGGMPSTDTSSPAGVFSWIKGSLGDTANPMQSTGKTAGTPKEVAKQAMFKMITKMFLGGA